MGAGGGICESARAELLRPGLSAGGAGMSIDLSGGRATGIAAGVATGEIGFAAAGFTTSLTGFETFAGAEAEVFEAGLPGFDAASVLPAGFFGVALTSGLATGFEVFPATPVLGMAGLAITGALTGAFDGTLTAAFLLATGLVAFLGADLTVTLAFTAGFAELLVFFAGTFTVSLLLKPLSERPANYFPALPLMVLPISLFGYFGRRARLYRHTGMPRGHQHKPLEIRHKYRLHPSFGALT